MAQCVAINQKSHTCGNVHSCANHRALGHYLCYGTLEFPIDFIKNNKSFQSLLFSGNSIKRVEYNRKIFWVSWFKITYVWCPIPAKIELFIFNTNLYFQHTNSLQYNIFFQHFICNITSSNCNPLI